MSDTWGRRLFKAGGVFLILLGLVHSISLFQKMAATNDTEKQLVDLMNNYRFDMIGSLRNMAELVHGFSLAFMISVLGPGILDLSISGERPGLLKRVALVNPLWMAALTANSVRYFFVVPTSLLAVGYLNLPLMRVFEWIEDNPGALIVSAIASVFASFGAWLMTIFVAAKFVRGEWSYGVPLAFGIPAALVVGVAVFLFVFHKLR